MLPHTRAMVAAAAYAFIVGKKRDLFKVRFADGVHEEASFFLPDDVIQPDKIVSIEAEISARKPDWNKNEGMYYASLADGTNVRGNLTPEQNKRVNWRGSYGTDEQQIRMIGFDILAEQGKFAPKGN